MSDELIDMRRKSPDAQAREDYNSLVALFGRNFLPDSIMSIKREVPDGEEDELAVKRGYTASQTEEHQTNQRDERIPKRLRQMWHLSGRGSLNGALSKFPQGIGRTTVLMYSNPGDVIVDPFAGHNSRMELVVKAGRHYIGCDICQEFMDFNRRKAESLKKKYPEQRVSLHQCDSRKQPIPSGIGDMTITSPPYYDIEYYGPEEEQLGRCKTYEEFMEGMDAVLGENYRTLKEGAFSCWFINDFRQSGKFHYYHRDILDSAKRAGFVGWDVMIVDLGRCVRDCFINQAKQLRILPKRHEYCMVFRKPIAKEGLVR